MDQAAVLPGAWRDEVAGGVAGQALDAVAQIAERAFGIDAAAVDHARQIADHAAEAAFALTQGERRAHQRGDVSDEAMPEDGPVAQALGVCAHFDPDQSLAWIFDAVARSTTAQSDYRAFDRGSEIGAVRVIHGGKGNIRVFDQLIRADSVQFACTFTGIKEAVAAVAGALQLVNHARQQAGDFLATFEQATAGASDFIMKPFRLDQMMASIETCLAQQQVQRENIVLKRQVDQLYDSGMIGNCDTMRSVCDVIKQVAPMPTTVLIEGESGTGKELAARALHHWSRRKGSFVPVNCGAISEELMESEFFGHTKGAFTGAQKTREGLFTYANGGTLFLDEIGEMPLSMQVHLLRVLEERVIRPVGSNREIPIDVRIIAATNKDLLKQVEKKAFREDLFYRLNVVNVLMPPLRERSDDIPALASHFSNTLASELGVSELAFSADDLFNLRAYGWPGNIRELKNIIERCLLLGKKPGHCIAGQAMHNGNQATILTENNHRLDEVEKRHILHILDKEGGNKSAAARILGVSRKTLERKVKVWNQV